MKKEIKLVTIATIISLILNACSGGDSGTVAETGTPAISGILTDSPVDGAKYICGNVTNRTGKDGSFFCETGPIQFYVGDVKLGEVNQLLEDKYVTPQDLAGVGRDVFNENVSKIAVFLQSLDNDGEMDESIILDDALIEKLDERHLELQHMTHSELIELLDSIGVSDIVTEDDALNHLQNHMNGLEEPTTEEPTNTDDPTESNPETSEPDDTTPEETLVTEETEETTEETQPTLDDAMKQAYLDTINEARSEGRECGEYGYFSATSALTWNEQLYDASYEHSKDMAISNTFSHTGSGTQSDETAEAIHSGTGSSVSERIEHNGYTNWRRYGENIAAGTSMDEAIEAMEGWLASPGHCKNIMKPEFTEVGMAIYYNENSHYKYYWTQDFGTK